MTVRERPKAVTLTERAAERVKSIMSSAEQNYVGVRIGVEKGGCAGMAYTMDYAEEIAPLDEVIEDKGVRILIDPKAILFLIGTEMDWEQEKFSSGFKFNNPNAVDACGCGESFTITPAVRN
ncbi:MAG: Fe-S cluster assembly scaffold SufA [Rhodobiaceae bacterium]|nr:MAG: Fe-S cluster assembly scaffold SufA [Rhodobiaceae bacterium]